MSKGLSNSNTQLASIWTDQSASIWWRLVMTNRSKTNRFKTVQTSVGPKNGQKKSYTARIGLLKSAWSSWEARECHSTTQIAQLGAFYQLGFRVFLLGFHIFFQESQKIKVQKLKNSAKDFLPVARAPLQLQLFNYAPLLERDVRSCY